MSMPRTEGWYDDPDGSDAERYFDGQEWTPRRRRKEPAPKFAPRTTDSHAAGFGNPPSDPYGLAPPAAPGTPYGAYPPPPPAGPYGSAPAPGIGDPYGTAPHYGYPQQGLSRLRSTMVVGIQRTLGLLIAGSGLALIGTSVLPWGKIREVDHSDGSVVATTVSFPGLGEPKISGTVSDGVVSGTFNANSPLLQLHNTSPGWIALMLGVAAVAAGAAILWVPQQRNVIAISIAVLGGAAGILCVVHLFDLRATFDNPPNLADESFSPGGGLVSAAVLSFAVTALGVWAFFVEARSRRPRY